MNNFMKKEFQGRPLTPKDGCALFGIAFLALLFVYLFIFPPSYYPRYAAKRSVCLSNLKQLGMATQLYAADESDTLPPFLTTDIPNYGQSKFVSVLTPYIRDQLAWQCPEIPNSMRSGSYSGVDGTGKTSYVHASEFARLHTFKLEDIRDPANTPYLRDPVRSIEDDEGTLLIKSGHGLKFNLAFVDGHAKTVGMDREGLTFPKQEPAKN